MPMLSGKGTPMIRAFAKMNILEMGCGIFRKKVIDRIGKFDPRVLGTEDYLYCFRAATAGVSWHFHDAPMTSMLVRHHAVSFSKDRSNSYRKELETRLLMRPLLQHIGDKIALAINDDRYAWRMRRLHDVLIDRTIKSGGRAPRKKELEWVFRHSSLRQNLYFFPRIVKAVLFPLKP
jgi:GT2 family glycosyltransferase